MMKPIKTLGILFWPLHQKFLIYRLTLTQYLTLSRRNLKYHIYLPILISRARFGGKRVWRLKSLTNMNKLAFVSGNTIIFSGLVGSTVTSITSVKYSEVWTSRKGYVTNEVFVNVYTVLVSQNQMASNCSLRIVFNSLSVLYY